MAYDADPVRWNHELVVGTTYRSGVVALVDSAGSPHDLTGVTGAAYVRREIGGAVLLEAAVEIVSAADGTFQWSASAVSTAALEPGRYLYAVRLTWPGGDVRDILEGQLTVRQTAGA